MKKHFKSGEPVVRNRAAVIHSKLKIKFLSKDQLELFITEVIKDDYPSFKVETNPGDSITMTEYFVTFSDIAWANNLVGIGKILAKIDYNSDV